MIIRSRVPASISVMIATTITDKLSLWTQTTQLRGVNLWQSRNYVELHGEGTLGDGPVGPPFTQDYFDDLAALGNGADMAQRERLHEHVAQCGRFDRPGHYGAPGRVRRKLVQQLVLRATTDDMNRRKPVPG